MSADELTEDAPQESKRDLLARVAEAAATCVRCDLAENRSRVVFGEGSPDALLMFIGEGPGQNEAATGLPFVGRSGALLDECMRENGITRKHVYITNVIRCRACEYQNGRLQNRPPTPNETTACHDWLQQTIDIIQPLVIVCLGSPAANAIIRKGFKLMQERGQWFDCSYARYAMATLHPAYILRQEGDAYAETRRTLVADIGAARQKVIEARREPPKTLF